jgi:hypothetical protein
MRAGDSQSTPLWGYAHAGGRPQTPMCSHSIQSHRTPFVFPFQGGGRTREAMELLETLVFKNLNKQSV